MDPITRQEGFEHHRNDDVSTSPPISPEINKALSDFTTLVAKSATLRPNLLPMIQQLMKMISILIRDEIDVELGGLWDHLIGKRYKISVAVFGNISSGKSLLCDVIEEVFKGRCDIIKEPVAKWQENGLLKAFYDDISPNNPNKGQRQMALTFQHYAFVSRLILNKLIEPDPNKIIVHDAHVLVDRHCFAENLKDDGLIDKQQMTWYNEMFDMWNILCPSAEPELILYLKTDPQVCFERNLIRQKISRPEESNIDLKYLEGLSLRNDRLTSMDLIKNKVIVLDGNQSAEQVAKSALSFISRHTPIDDNGRSPEEIAINALRIVQKREEEKNAQKKIIV